MIAHLNARFTTTMVNCCLARTFDYCMQRADDVPDIGVGFTLTPAQTNPLGMKWCGEAGAIGARDFDMPATSEKVWRVIPDQGL